MQPMIHRWPAAATLGEAPAGCSPRPRRGAYRIVWPVAPGALDRSPLAEAARRAPADEPARLTWTVELRDDGTAAAALELAVGTGRAVLAEGARATIAGDRDGHTHIIIPGHLSAVIDAPAGAPPRLLYAATQWLTRLGVPGGRADPPRLALAPAAAGDGGA